jgi:hypothetical protein
MEVGVADHPGKPILNGVCLFSSPKFFIFGIFMSCLIHEKITLNEHTLLRLIRPCGGIIKRS